MADLSTLELILGFLLSISTAAAGYFGVIRKARADEATVVLNAWKDLLQPLKDELSVARTEINELRLELIMAEERHKKEQEKWLRQIKSLKQQIENK